MPEFDFKMCKDCKLAIEQNVPKSLLEEQAAQARREYMRPKALLLQEVIDGKNTRVIRTCKFGGLAFGSTICGDGTIFTAKT